MKTFLTKTVLLKTTLLALAVVAMALTACKDKPTDPATSDLVGNWAWIESVGGIAGMTLKPDAQNWRSLEFQANGKYLEWRNNDIIMNSTYAVVKGESIFGDGIVDLIRIPATGENANTLILRRSHNDTLIVDDNHIDGFRSTYIRVIKEPLR
jgi:hypothetical protein